jgi:cation diffusion facilitator family transporter
MQKLFRRYPNSCGDRSMHQHQRQSDNSQIRRITNVGIGFNVLLAIFKFSVGYLAGSIALIADGVHSLSDLTTDIALLVGVYFGSKRPDPKHPWGHGRIETFAAGFIAVALVIGGVLTMYAAGVGIYHRHTVKPSYAVLAVALASVISKEWLYWATRKIAIRTNSSATYANAWHHRSDAFSSVAVVIGFIALKMGFPYGDHAAAIVVGLMIVFVGARVFGDCVAEFAEAAADVAIVAQIENIIKADLKIHDWHNLRTRIVGREIFLDVHILVDPKLTISEAHDVSESLENAVRAQISQPVNIIVHMEPDISRLRTPGEH